MTTRSRILKITILFFLCFLIPSQSFSFEIKVREISDNVKIFSGGVWNENIVAIASQKGIVVIDAPFSRSVTMEFKKAIEKEFGRDDFIYLINTHSCFCHVGGNLVYKNHTIIGHEFLVQEMQEAALDTSNKWSIPCMIKYTNDYMKYCKEQMSEKPDEKKQWESQFQFWKQVQEDYINDHEIIPPNLVFKDRMTLNLGDVTIELYSFNYSHAKSSILVFIPNVGLFIEHGIFSNKFLQTFMLDEDTPTNLIEGWVSTLDELLEGDKIKFVLDIHDAGYKTIDDVKVYRDYYKKLLQKVRFAHQSGSTLEETKKQLSIKNTFKDYSQLMFSSEHHPKNIENMWKLLEKSKNE